MKDFKIIVCNIKKAFTMAEILISLTIIGIIAAITLPALQGNINEKVWNTQRKALYSRISQAIAMMPALNGYGIGATQQETNTKASMTFITDGLSKVLAINNICDNIHIRDCGVSDTYIDAKGEKLNTPTDLYGLSLLFKGFEYNGLFYKTENYLSAAFETKNGESVLLNYNPSCLTEMWKGINSYGNERGYLQSIMCANFIYDLNGLKGPNTYGKDIGFITVFKSIDSEIVAPMPVANWSSSSMPLENVSSYCRNQNPDTRVPNLYEIMAVMVNHNLVGLKQNNSAANDFWSGTKVNATSAWVADIDLGIMYISAGSPKLVWCIKR